MSAESMDRREFARLLAVGAAAVPLSACGSRPAEPPLPPTAPLPSAPAEAERPRGGEAEVAAESPRSEAELIAEILGQRYPDERLNGEVLTEIRGDIESDLARGRSLSAFRLANGDGPGTFAAWRGEG